MEIFISRAPPCTVSIADNIARTPAKRKPGPCGPGLVRRRGGVDDSPSRGEHLPALQSPIWEDEATACRAAHEQYASRGAGTQRGGRHASHAVVARCISARIIAA